MVRRKYRLFAILVSVLLLSGCGEPEYRVIVSNETYCPSETRAVQAEFVSDCIVNANPMSDEEPEDWIKQCQWTSEDLFCETRSVTLRQIKTRDTAIWRVVPEGEYFPEHITLNGKQ